MSDDLLPRENAPRGRWPFGWLGLFALAWIVYELTHSPAWGASFVCFKFGWEDCQTARWLWRNDPVSGRRRATFWLYLSWAMWKIGIVAFLMSFAFAAITPRPQVPQGVPQALLAFLGTFCTTLLAFGLSALLAVLAVGYAWIYEHRLWLDNGVHRARRQDHWPPTLFCQGRSNRLGLVLLTALALVSFFLVALLFAWLPRSPTTSALLFVVTITAPVSIVLIREILACKIWAETPSECWPEDWDDSDV